MSPRLRRSNALVAALLLLALTGCGGIDRQAFTEEDIRVAQPVVGVAARSWADQPLVFDQAARERFAAPRDGALDILAISGGGPDGAFGSGVLIGWTESGARPEFEIVTGVSVGSMIAPFAFLGAETDPELEAFFLGLDQDEFQLSGGLGTLLWEGAFYSQEALRAAAEIAVTPERMAEIAEAHADGRRLYVATASLDAERMSVWDIGAIAASGHPDALSFIHAIIIASGTIPAAFPPAFIETQADGRILQELHADGGMVSVFWTPNLRDVPIAAGPRRLHVMVNNGVEPGFKFMESGAIASAERAFGTLIRVSTYDRLRRVERSARDAGFEFRVAYLRDGAPVATTFQFESAHMRRVFDIGRETGRDGTAWLDAARPAYFE